MILRNLSKHLKEQNWFAVFLDLFIVVVGVFIGIQVANWNESKKEKTEFDHSLSRLQEEIVTNTTNLKQLGINLQDRLTRVNDAIEILRACEDSDENQQKVSREVATISGTIGIHIENTVLFEITETPHLSQQLSQQVKKDLEKLKTIAQFILSEAKFSEELPLRNLVPENPIVLHGELIEKTSKFYGIEITDKTLRLYIEEPVSAACKNTDLLNSFYTWQIWQEQQHANITTLHQAFENASLHVENGQ